MRHSCLTLPIIFLYIFNTCKTPLIAAGYPASSDVVRSEHVARGAVLAGPFAVVAGPVSFQPDVAAAVASAADALFQPAVVVASAGNVASQPAAVVEFLIVVGCGSAVVLEYDELHLPAAAAPLSDAVPDAASVPALPLVARAENAVPDSALTGFPGRLLVQPFGARGETGKTGAVVKPAIAARRTALERRWSVPEEFSEIILVAFSVQRHWPRFRFWKPLELEIDWQLEAIGLVPVGNLPDCYYLCAEFFHLRLSVVWLPWGTRVW